MIEHPAPNTAVKAAPFGRWTLRDKTPRSAPYLRRYASSYVIRQRARKC